MSDTELAELDAWIAEHVMAYRRGHPMGCVQEYWQPPPYKFGVIPVEKLPRFTIDPAAAMEVLEKCAEKADKDAMHIRIMLSAVGFYVVSANHSHWDLTGQEAETLPLAICLFAKQLFSKEEK